jgi:hypothetical protein
VNPAEEHLATRRSAGLFDFSFMGLYELLNLAHFGFPWGGVLGQGLANAVLGIVILQALELLPGAAERRQGDRGSGFRATRRLD